ncbi:hypothetical protein CVT26_006577 [Gymnopilus dilepis]|uniref:Uncharacterized protein n=1 Tax=Gymnopilus dilepis TaxID=231916 RepID=A0A409Y2Z0_9AGAR|nr:hypothetical protein CVT26_006577 [Gymnopilus dilepis]
MNTDDVIDIIDEWRRPIEQEVDRYRGIIDQLNTMTVVAVFIAGVQAQLLAISLGLPPSRIVHLTNIFLFLGLCFEISGVAMGATHSLLLQNRIKSSNRSLSDYLQFRSDMVVVLKAYFREAQARQDHRPADETREDDTKDNLNLTTNSLPALDKDEYQRRLQSAVNFIKNIRASLQSEVYILQTINSVAQRLQVQVAVPVDEIVRRHSRRTRLAKLVESITDASVVLGLAVQVTPALMLLADLEPSLGDMPVPSTRPIAIACAVIFVGVLSTSQIPVLILLLKDLIRSGLPITLSISGGLVSHTN